MKIISVIAAIILALIGYYLFYTLFMDGVEERVRKVVEGKKEVKMSTAKMNKINAWMQSLDQKEMDLNDQLALSQATMEYFAKLEPIYDKYQPGGGSAKGVRYR